ncbi:putative ribonuclease H protein [Panicum miliaceum]|uniref:Ribonuclease H protein n=1 Tax=Panicum miliaceum TaxID=4540 RepID=A0A3L6RU12_PANMI|nr:putative ribonuclease H protein [Panicum miliaceum]
MHGTYSSFDGGSIWRAHTEGEGKQKFFGWLLVQSKILTADKLMARNWQCNECSFAKEIWFRVRTWARARASIPLPTDEDTEVEAWWARTLAPLTKQQRRSTAAIILYTAWHIWKERNRRVLEAKSLRPERLWEPRVGLSIFIF